MCPNLFFAGCSQTISDAEKKLISRPMHVQAGSFQASLHHPEGTEFFFNNVKIEGLIERWKAEGDIKVFEEILGESIPMIRRLMLCQQTTKFVPFEDLLSRIQVKLFKHLNGFNSAKGTAFSYLSKITKSVLCGAVREVMDKPEFAEFDGNVPERSVPGTRSCG